MDRKVKGYTIMEILVIIAILSILAGFAFVSFRNIVLNQRLKASTDNLVSVLNTARMYSMTGGDVRGIGPRPWGVYVTEDGRRFILFEDTNSNCRCDNNCNNGEEVVKTFQMESGVKVRNPLVIVFDKKGYPRNAICGFGATNIIIESETLNKARTICISRYGRIRVVEGEITTCVEN